MCMCRRNQRENCWTLWLEGFLAKSFWGKVNMGENDVEIMKEMRKKFEGKVLSENEFFFLNSLFV